MKAGGLLLIVSLTRVLIYNDEFYANVDDKLWIVCATLPTALALMWIERRCRRLFANEGERLAAACAIGWVASLATTLYYLTPDRRAPLGWSLLASLLLALGWLRRRKASILLADALALLAMGAAGVGWAQSCAPTDWLGALWRPEALACVVLFASLGLACPLAHAEGRGEAEWSGGLAEIAMRLFFFLPLAMGLLLLTELRGGRSTLALIAYSSATFAAALAMRVSLFRRTGLVLLLGCVAKIALLDVWSFAPGERALTLLVMGLALVGVSYLYALYKDVLLRYL